ncbi:hypothetical protein LTR37_000435 [Vermiconidia calcicola]|uniref:Uncharacterized protein n=1 Tax=Vermiconidia calcicola TaxID=1690605 RepID=A0ACC3NYT6_9PEZI|nr:hypothetical protein LTR37_000435 [Vermiconidia calcicola]
MRPNRRVSQRLTNLTVINEPEPVCASKDDRYGHHQSDEDRELNEMSASRRNSRFDKELFGDSFALPIRSSAPALPQRLFSNSENGNLEEASTACWDQYRFQPYRHVLTCGHVIDTAKVRRACGPNCRPSSGAESKSKGPQILCLERTCVRVRKVQAAREVSIFVPRKGKAPTRRPTPRAAKKTSEPMQTNGEDSLFLPEASQAVEPAKATLPPRELANLRTDGTAALRYGTARRGRASGVPGSDKQARQSKSVKVEEQTYEFQGNGAMGQAQDSDPDTGMWSMAEDKYDQNANEQPGRVLRDLSPSQLLPRIQVDVGDEDDMNEDDSTTLEAQVEGVQPDGSYAAPEIHCVCKSPHDSKMQQCVECERSFHPECIGKKMLGRCKTCAVSRAKNLRMARQKSGKGTQASFLEQNRAARAEKHKFQKSQIQLYGTPQEQVRRRVHGHKVPGTADADSMDLDPDSV